MRTTVSVDIGSRNMHIVEGYFQKEEVTVTKAHTVLIPQECQKNEAISNIPLLAHTLSETLKTAGFKAKDAIVTINATQAVVRDLDLPMGKPKELDGMVKQEMMNTFNVPEDDFIQYKLLSQIKGTKGETLNRYRTAALDQDLVQSYYDLLKEAKLKPLAMDININAIGKLLNGSGSMVINDKVVAGEVVMLLDFGAKSTTVYIAAKDSEVFFRHLTFGSEEIEQIITDELLTVPEDVRLAKEAGESFFEGDQGAAYFKTLKPYFYKFNDEIRRMIGFYNSRFGSANISAMYLFGEGSKLAGLPEYWESNLNIHVERIRSISKLSRQSKIEDIAPYLNAIGALIRY